MRVRVSLLPPNGRVAELAVALALDTSVFGRESSSLSLATKVLSYGRDGQPGSPAVSKTAAFAHRSSNLLPSAMNRKANG